MCVITEAKPSLWNLLHCHSISAVSDSSFHISLRGYSAFTECVQNKAYILVVKTFKKTASEQYDEYQAAPD